MQAVTLKLTADIQVMAWKSQKTTVSQNSELSSQHDPAEVDGYETQLQLSVNSHDYGQRGNTLPIRNIKIALN